MGGTLILLSGGMNSTVALYEILNNDDFIGPYHAITFEDGKDIDEISAAKSIFKEAIAKFIPSPVSITSLEDLPNHEIQNISKEIYRNQADNSNGLYLRLLQFLIPSAIYAIDNSFSDIVIGISSDRGNERSPELEKDFIGTVETTIMLAASLSSSFHKRPKLHIPLMEYNKAQIFKKAYDLDILKLVLNNTITCESSIRTKPDFTLKTYEWGKGCESCDACLSRKKGWEQYWEQYQKELLQQEIKQAKSLNAVEIDGTVYTGVGSPARWTILERDDDGKSSIITTHGKQQLFTLPESAWDWIKNQNTPEKFYTVTGQDTARHIMREQGGD